MFLFFFLTLSLNLTLIMPIFEHKKQEGIFPLTWPLNPNQQISITWFSQTFLCVCLLVSIFPLRSQIHLLRLKSWTASFCEQTLYKQYHSRKLWKHYLELNNKNNNNFIYFSIPSWVHGITYIIYAINRKAK